MAARTCVLVSVVVMLGAVAELGACGSKYLAIGGSRSGTFAASYDASIVVYVPGGSSQDVGDYVKELRRAGHRQVQPALSPADLTEALAALDYDIVITLEGDAEAARALAGQARSRPAVVPVVDAPSGPRGRQLLNRLEQQYGHVLVQRQDRRAQIETLDRVMQERLRRA